jgi:hypothetical protein
MPKVLLHYDKPKPMIKFFRKIRYDLMEKNKTGKYLKYAIGEIILVMIGILLALQVNTWNEGRKTNKIEKQIFKNLLTSLKKDSTELVRIIDYQVKSVKQHNRIINSTASEITSVISEDSISNILHELCNGRYSFFPKYGIYNSIVSSKGLDILKSEDIRSKLIDLYDYEYKRYESIDKVLDQRFDAVFIPFLNREIGFYVNSSFEHNLIDKTILDNNFSELQLQCKYLTSKFTSSLMLLQSIQRNVNKLIIEMRTEKRK